MDMKQLSMRYQILGIIGLILIGIVGRYVLFGMGVQPFPNFEIIMVLTFIAALLFRPSIAFFVPLFSMIGSDVLIGNPIFVGDQMNRIILFTYSGFALIALINIFNRDRLWNVFGKLRLRNVGIAAGLGVGFVLLYDVWTNIGWWYLLYPHNASSLGAVFAAGAPFMLYHLISGAVTFVAIAVPILYYVSKKSSFSAPFTLKSIHKIPVVIAVIGLIALSFSGTAMKVPTKSEVWLEKSNQTSVEIIILGEGWTITDNVVAYQSESVFSLLQRSSTETGYALKSTYYAQFDSSLIDSINNLANGQNGKYWQYYVNGDIPMIGADKCTVSNGDVVEWRFETVPS